MLDKIYSQVLNFKLKGEIPKGSRFAQYRFKNHYSLADWSVKGDKLYFKSKEIIQDSEISKVLKSLYDNPTTMVKGRDRFYSRVAEKYAGISKETVMQFLQNQETYQLHRAVYKQKVVKPILTSGPREIFQVDLIDMSSLEYWNNGHNWILTVIDLFSKHAWAISLKNKQAITVAKAIETLLETEKPKIVQSDRGSEFISDPFKNLLKRLGIVHRLSRSHTPQSQGGIEKFNGTLKRLIYAYFTQYGTKQYVDVLDKLVLNYNTTKHGTTKFTPEQLKNASYNNKRIASHNIKKSAQRVISTDQRLFGKSDEIKIGDSVRVAKSFLNAKTRTAQRTGIGQLAKKYRILWSHELYKVMKVNRRKQGLNTYALEGIDETVPIDQIQLVNPETLVAAPKMKDKLPVGVRNEEIFN